MDEEAKGTALNQISYGLYVVGSAAGDEINGMTLNWLTQLSFDPPLVGIACQNSSYSRQLIDAGGVFSVNLIGQDGKGLLTRFIKPHRRVGEKLGSAEGESEYYTASTGAPILKEALSWFECRVVQAIATGDHTFYIGEVVGAGVHRPGEAIRLADSGWHYGG